MADVPLEGQVNDLTPRDTVWALWASKRDGYDAERIRQDEYGYWLDHRPAGCRAWGIDRKLTRAEARKLATRHGFPHALIRSAEECWVTGYRCVRSPGHRGPHESGEGLLWGGEACDPATGQHVMAGPPYGQQPRDCKCGKHRGISHEQIKWGVLYTEGEATQLPLL